MLRMLVMETWILTVLLYTETSDIQILNVFMNRIYVFKSSS